LIILRVFKELFELENWRQWSGQPVCIAGHMVFIWFKVAGFIKTVKFHQASSWLYGMAINIYVEGRGGPRPPTTSSLEEASLMPLYSVQEAPPTLQEPNKKY